MKKTKTILSALTVMAMLVSVPASVFTASRPTITITDVKIRSADSQ